MMEPITTIQPPQTPAGWQASAMPVAGDHTRWVSTYSPPTQGWEKAVDNSGRFFNNNYPIITGVQRALMSSPRDANSLSGGIKGVVNGLAFQYFVKKGHQFDGYLKQKFPAYGEFANRNPNTAGVISFLGILFPASTLAALVSDNPAVSKVADFLGIKGKQALQGNGLGRKAISGWRSVAKVLRHPISIGIQLVALGALFIGLVAKNTKNNNQFRPAYKAVRAQYPDRQQVPPDVLRASVVSVLNQQKLAETYGIPPLSEQAVTYGQPAS
jgi:hypothetical protein